MPKKPNFLGGMQNYNPNNGEYEPNLVGSNGKVVKDADGDGVSHESKKLPKLNNDYKTDKNGNKYLEFSSEKEAHSYADKHDLPDGTVVYDNKIYFGKEEQDFNDPSEAEHNKAEEKEFSEIKYEKKTDIESNEDVDWDLAQKNERINGSKAKSKSRKDKYGNPLISDEAFKVGQEVAKQYLKDSLKYDSLDSLKRSNVFLGYMSDYVRHAIINNGYNPNLDTTYQDYNEIIGSVVGEEVDLEAYAKDATKGWTGKKYTGYNPIGNETSDVEGINDEEIDEELFDRTWAITDKTSVKDYAEFISENLKVPYERVLARIRKNKPEAKETDKMSVVAELED